MSALLKMKWKTELLELVTLDNSGQMFIKYKLNVQKYQSGKY